MLATILCMIVSVCAQAIVILYPGVWVFWFTFHGKISQWRTMGKRAYWYACLGWPAIGITLLFFRRWIFGVRWPVPPWMTIPGILALVAAAMCGLQASKVISHNTLIGLVELEPDRNPQPMMQTGVYARTRNPIYLTHWLVILAFAVLSGYAANWAFVVLDLVIMQWMIRFEEKELIARYGDEFRSYMRRVPRFFPRWPW